MLTQSSIEVDLVSVDDIISKMKGIILFLQEQYNCIHQNILHNKISSIKLKTDGKTSSGNRTLHYEINLTL